MTQEASYIICALVILGLGFFYFLWADFLRRDANRRIMEARAEMERVRQETLASVNKSVEEARGHFNEVTKPAPTISRFGELPILAGKLTTVVQLSVRNIVIEVYTKQPVTFGKPLAICPMNYETLDIFIASLEQARDQIELKEINNGDGSGFGDVDE